MLRANVDTRSVFASPGTPSISACPPHARAIMTSSMTRSCPTMTECTAARSRSAAAFASAGVRMAVDASDSCIAEV